MAVLVLVGLSLAACCLIFPPVGWWWLAYVCLVPWLVAVCTARKAWFIYLASFLFGLGYFLINVHWLYPVTPPGYIALCCYYAVFFPLAAWPVRHMYTRHGVSIALSAPIVWVAAEYLRSLTALGFPWVLLGHSQYEILTMIQISDLVGAYGVSFVLAMVNGWITDLLIQPILIWRTGQATRLPIGSLTTLLVLAGTLIYGSAQRSQRLFEPGPNVAIVQHDFPMYVDGRGADREYVFQAYLDLARKAAQEKPDLVVLPETIVSGYMNDEFLTASPTDLEEMLRRRFPPGCQLGYLTQLQRFGLRIRSDFQQLSDETGVPIVLGALSMEWRPTVVPQRVDAYNSAFLIKPGETKPVARYDKIHLVLFGEYVPFRYTHRSLYEWLNSLTPWGQGGNEYSLAPGDEYDVFEVDAVSRGMQRYRMAVPICYEEIMPYITRRFVKGGGDQHGKKNIDLLLSISNDGWFLHSSELEQHMAAAVFRAVENRIAVVRSVNTGASAVIHPNGRIHCRVELPNEKFVVLDRVAAALQKIDGIAGRMQAASASEQSYLAGWEEMISVMTGDLPAALGAVGPGIDYVQERLARRVSRLNTPEPRVRFDRLKEVRTQATEDLEMIRRWREKPWTAPGYAVVQVMCDNRLTIYSQWGDWFAMGALALSGMMLLDWLLRRIYRLAALNKAKEGETT
ncbi:MAG: apolipoprotein N-acyltransferase [Planctomycetota bacterium]